MVHFCWPQWRIVQETVLARANYVNSIIPRQQLERVPINSLLFFPLSSLLLFRWTAEKPPSDQDEFSLLPISMFSPPFFLFLFCLRDVVCEGFSQDRNCSSLIRSEMDGIMQHRSSCAQMTLGISRVTCRDLRPVSFRLWPYGRPRD